ncbi:MAG: putative glycoside hydrolase [Clostridiales bacterium]|nr:putative glycoside hydrolase [Clostridiales bacterium]
MRTIVQAFTGGLSSTKAYTDGDTEKLISSIERSGAESAIIGWNAGAPYGKITSTLHEMKKKAFLWLPVFSELGEEAVVATDYLGHKHAGAVSGAEDDFTFACPSEPGNIGLAAECYDRYFSGCGFDGVFLDKIRFSSFGNGFESGMGCYCKRCTGYYNSEGVDMGEFMELMESSNKSFLIPKALHGMRYSFENALIDRLFAARAKLMAESVAKAVGMFRQRGLEVGLDVFAPTFAYLFGQDIEALAEWADFIKPMIYRVTDAPAGIPYEAVHMKTELERNGCNIGDKLAELWGTEELHSDGCFKKQLTLLGKLPCRVYSGVEVNKADFCATSAEYVENTIKAACESEIAGCVLSWNVLAETVYPL